MSKIIGAGLILLLVGTASPAQKAPEPLSAQKRSKLEKERATLRKELSSVKRSLKETHQHRQQSLTELALVQHKLSVREKAIRKTDAEVHLIHHTLDQSGQTGLRLQRQLDSLRNLYAQEVVSGYKDRNRFDYLSFIFSAASFNDALMRVQYLRTYKEYNAEHEAHMRQEEQALQDKINELKAARLEKEFVLKQENKERMVLGTEKNEKATAVNRLQLREKELEGQIAARQRQDRKLATALAAVVTRAKNERRPTERLPAATGTKERTEKNKPTYREVPCFDNKADLLLSASFEKTKGHLPWPVDSRNIAMAFGLHVYPNGLQGNNAGLTLTAAAGSPVKAVFEGEVGAIFVVGDVEAVVVRHGHYYTTYSNLSGVSVTKGEQIEKGRVVGQVAEIGQLEFLLSDEKDHMFDPAKWLSR